MGQVVDPLRSLTPQMMATPRRRHTIVWCLRCRVASHKFTCQKGRTSPRRADGSNALAVLPVASFWRAPVRQL